MHTDAVGSLFMSSMEHSFLDLIQSLGKVMEVFPVTLSGLWGQYKVVVSVSLLKLAHEKRASAAAASWEVKGNRVLSRYKGKIQTACTALRCWNFTCENAVFSSLLVWSLTGRIYL